MRCFSSMLMLALSACGGGADPCADVSGPPLLALGGTDDDGVGFEAFAPGSERNLVLGPQGGMHVWLSARARGVCPTDTVLDRRVIDEITGSVYQVVRGPAEWTEIEPELFELADAVPVILCPEPLRRPVVGRTLRLVVAVIDEEGRRAEAQLPFVPACPAGVDCESICR